MKGYIQVYTGNGKGKTTAALGLTLRAYGAGLSVFIGQFIKSGDYSEIKALKVFHDNVTVKQYGEGRFIMGKPSQEDIAAAQKGISELQEIILSGKYDVVIMEEINVAVTTGIVELSQVLEILKNKPENVEIVLTGRGAAPEILEAADLVTEMLEIKHYMNSGVKGRIGIEK